MGIDDQGPNDYHLNYLWENQPSWGLYENSLSDDENETNNKNKLLDITTTPPPQRNKGVVIIEELSEGGGGGGSSVRNNNKRSRGGGTVIRNNKKGKRVVNGGGREGADHALHIWTERERRKKMRNMFATLHSLLPQLPSKADKSSIVDEAVRCIKSLEKTVEKMEKLKREKDEAVCPIGCESSVTAVNSLWDPYLDPITDQASSSSTAALKTFVSPNLVLSLSGNNQAQYNICVSKKPCLFTTIALVLHKYNLDVLYATMFSTPTTNKYLIIAHANKALVQFQDDGSVEQTFKRAAGEILMWLS